MGDCPCKPETRAVITAGRPAGCLIAPIHALPTCFKSVVVLPASGDAVRPVAVSPDAAKAYAALSGDRLLGLVVKVSASGADVVCWLLNVPATCECISGTDLLRQFYVLPH